MIVRVYTFCVIFFAKYFLRACITTWEDIIFSFQTTVLFFRNLLTTVVFKHGVQKEENMFFKYLLEYFIVIGPIIFTGPYCSSFAHHDGLAENLGWGHV